MFVYVGEGKLISSVHLQGQGYFTRIGMTLNVCSIINEVIKAQLTLHDLTFEKVLSKKVSSGNRTLYPGLQFE